MIKHRVNPDWIQQQAGTSFERWIQEHIDQDQKQKGQSPPQILAMKEDPTLVICALKMMPMG